MTIIRAACLLLCLAMPAWAMTAAAPPNAATTATRPLDLSDLAAPVFANFSARDGLPEQVMVDVRTDRDGFVWAASPQGVSRYDGRRWVPGNDPAMAHPVNNLFVDGTGTLWAGFRNHGLARYDGQRWHVENAASGLPFEQVRRFAETTDARGQRVLWATTWDHHVMQRRDGRWVKDPGDASLPGSMILSMAQTTGIDGVRRQWLGTGSHGLWYRDEGTRDWRQWHAEDIDAAQIEALLVTRDGDGEALWMSAFGVGLLRLDAKGLRRWTQQDGELPTNQLYDIAATPLPSGKSVIWIASRSGLLRVHDGRVQVFDRRHGLASDMIRGLNAWRSPNGSQVLWLATEAGISRTPLDGSAWSTASLMGSRSLGVFGVLIEPDGRGGERLWVGSSDEGLGLYEDGRWRRFSADSGHLPTNSISMIRALPEAGGRRTLWLGTWGGDLLRVDDGPRFTRQATPWPKLTGQSVQDVLQRTVDGRDELWVGTRLSGAWRLRDGRWDEIRPPGIDGQWRVSRFVAQRDQAGRDWLWAATDRGLGRFDGKAWALFDSSTGFPDEQLAGLRLYPDAGDRPILWMGSARVGIVRVDIGDPLQPRVLPATLPPPPDPYTYGAMRAPDGRVYVCSNTGVQQLTPDAQGGYSTRAFNRRDGMVHEECNGNAQFVDAHGRFWTGTLGGLTVYDPSRGTADTQPKPLRVTGMHIDGAAQSGTRLRVPAGAATVDVEYALLSWDREAESRFRSQLLGLESAPTPWTAQTARSFGALPPGDYTLRIEARDHAGNTSMPIDIPIHVAAHWWQRWWAYATSVLILVLLGYVIALARTRVLRAQHDALEQRVAERTAELDAANARLLDLSYRDALTGLANRRRLLDALERTPSGSLMALVFFDVDHFKELNDRHGHPAGDEVLRRIVDAMSSCTPADALLARYGGEEFACLLPGVTTAAAADVAERMRAAVEATSVQIPDGPQDARVSVSAGVASRVLRTLEDRQRLLRDADVALYQAKGEGRNCVRTSAD
ncbi:ligand-binding sensor domain-containing diguanylate cyclase [Thermomonas carbonis]|uniref:diguanylate cyclase n=1 Tax=Thermomonas carbonis TaxID=1463158 RepID=A0A7G9SPG1_9GAMM|nr:diguanylate cyclase [Thermomonas carbonis]QNN69736.1 diguanylate cyclase [Thermomonas carbonis]GHB95169.1 GGDEF domain-containing protein [Thermomonas carbonis]